jgi:hypothetical protein
MWWSAEAVPDQETTIIRGFPAKSHSSRRAEKAAAPALARQKIPG